MTNRRKITAIILFVASFSFIEASVVAYLQKAFFAGGSAIFPLRVIEQKYLVIEIIREAVTLILLFAASLMLENGRWRTLWMFSILFAGWDILYYVWLRVLVGFPSSLLDWDVLFLIPAPWLAPVIAPVTTAVLMIVFSCLMLRKDDSSLSGIEMTGCALSTLLVIWSFVYDSFGSVISGANSLTGFVPAGYHWGIFIAGLAIWIVSMGHAALIRK